MTDITTDKLVKVYIKIRDRKSELTKEYDAKIAELDSQKEAIENELLSRCTEQGATSINTEFGTVIRQLKTRYWVADWDSFSKYIVEQKAVHLLEKRVAQLNMGEFLEALPEGEVPPPGLQSDRSYVVVVRRKSN